MTNREAATSLEEAEKVQGRRRPVLTGSGRGLPGPVHPSSHRQWCGWRGHLLWDMASVMEAFGLWIFPRLLAVPVAAQGTLMWACRQSNMALGKRVG